MNRIASVARPQIVEGDVQIYILLWETDFTFNNKF